MIVEPLMKFLISAMALFSFLSCARTEAQSTIHTSSPMEQTSFYDLSVQSLDENSTIEFSSFKGKKVLLVNVASKCGFTPQYEGLQQLHETYGDEVVILGLPCNQFMYQEPGDKESIATFCKSNYGVSFPMTTKIKVKGSEQHPVYQWLTKKSMNGVGDYKVSWNFNKFLVNEEGQLIAYFDSKVKPMDDQIVSKIRS